MSYFGNGTLEDYVLSQVIYVQEDEYASNIAMIDALIKVMAYFIEREKSDIQNEN